MLQQRTGEWGVRRDRRQLDDQRTEHTLTYTDPKTGLVARAVAIEYHDFPTVEWTLYFRNTGSVDTPLLTDIRAIDTRFRRGKEGEFTLHHNTGSPAGPNDYQPHATPLPPQATQRIATSGGRSTNSDMPYFNVAWPGQGVIVVLGWPGQWAAEFSRDDGAGLRVRGGQELTRLKLHPGEEVRTPLAVVQFWKGDLVRSQNIWRRWMLAHNLPRPGGKPMPPGLMMCTSDSYPGMRSNAADEMKYVDAYVKAGVKLDYWWIDAGWYPCEPEGWPRVGMSKATWRIGMNCVAGIPTCPSTRVPAAGVKTIVWFEPQRVAAGTWLATEHPQWVLGGAGGGLLNLGDPKAWNWLVNHVDKLITKEGIDLYRQDYNIDPLGYWRGNDTQDRQGVTENKYVTGYLAYWDELLRRHPGMLIDSCASGGRRNDLETMRRAVPLLRSDYLFEPVGQQGHTYGISFWLPFHGTGYCPSNTVGWGWGTGGISYDPYTRRSNMCPSNTMCFDFRVDVDDRLIQKLHAEWLKVGADYFGDYYPLTAHSLEQNSWIAWQFHRPEAGRGMIQAFRRSGSNFYGGQFKLRGLCPDAQYELSNTDEPGKVTVSGRQLMERGTEIAIKQRPGAAVVVYERVDRQTPR